MIFEERDRSRPCPEIRPGEDVKIGETILVVEAMKAEFEVKATSTGKVQLHVKEGQVVQAGDLLASIA